MRDSPLEFERMVVLPGTYVKKNPYRHGFFFAHKPSPGPLLPAGGAPG
jgi:hypothetical protein